MSKPKVLAIGIDFQKDFVVENAPLQVQGAIQDSLNFSKFIKNNGRIIDDIMLSLDSHQAVHIAHPLFWVDKKNNHPSPFTVITEDMVMSGEMRAFNPAYQSWAEQYVKTLAQNQKYILQVWVPHCHVGTNGWSFTDDVQEAVYGWERDEFARLVLVPKGNNPKTEHYSAFKADVEISGDISTQPNQQIINTLQEFSGEKDQILVGGEAFNFCVYSTVRDILDMFGEDYAKRFVILEDCTSSILISPETEELDRLAKEDLKNRGTKFVKSTDWSL